VETVEINNLSEPVEAVEIKSLPPAMQNMIGDAEREAVNQLDGIILECTEILNAAKEIKTAIATRDLEAIRDGLKVFEDHTERQYHRMTVGYEPGKVYAFLVDIEEERETDAGIDADYEAAWDAYTSELADAQ
jgi:hypothetical protein